MKNTKTATLNKNMEQKPKKEKNNGPVKIGETREGEIKSLTKQMDQKDRIAEIRKIFTSDIRSDEDDLKEFDRLELIKKPSKKQKDRREELSLKITMVYGLKNGLWAKNLSYTKYHRALGRIRHDIVTEYSCKTTLELMLADRRVACFWRAMNCDTAFNLLSEKEDGEMSFNQLRVNILKEFNKGIESANRQLNADIILLQELKQPALKVNVKTNTAFVSQNQQFNINPTNKNNSNENIESK
jgi:hypothetical protein